MKPKQEKLIKQKTNEFCEEVKSLSLTEENKRIYNAFVYRRSKPYKFEVIDKYNNTLKNGQTYKLIVALKQSGTGTNVLKSFYSDRK